MAFEIYQVRKKKKKKKAAVTLSKKSIVLNCIARQKLNTKKVEIAFDKESNIIRLKASSEGIELRKTKVFGQGFFNQFNITNKGKYDAEYIESENALFIHL